MKAFRLDLTPEQAASLADALQEVADAPLDHPSIVRPIAAGLEGTLAYAATEYVAAESLDIALRHYAPASIEKVLPFVTQLAGAIDFARAAGIGHGALHPRDIFVTPDEARATGFGVVQALERLGVRAPVRRPYTAPERVAGGAWDVRADVYSLAAIAYELMTGRRAVGARIDDLGASAGTHGEALAVVLSRALSDEPNARYPGALAFAAALEAASRGERTTTAVEEVSALSNVGAAAPPLRYELDEDAEVDEERTELDADLAEIQLREEEALRDDAIDATDAAGARDARTRVAGPEQVIPDEEPIVQPPVSARGEEPSLFDLDLAGARATTPEPERRFDPSEFEEPESDRDAEPEPIVMPASFEREPDQVEPAADRNEMEPVEPFDTEPYDRDEAGEPLEPVEPLEPAGPGAARAHRSRPVLLPVAITLLLGLFVGFLAGYLVGARDRETGTSLDAATTAPPPTAAPSRAAPPQSAPARESRPSPSPPSAPRREAPAPAATGRLVVRSTPPGAQVFVNGRRRGTTPLSVRNLAAGTYTVRVARSGFRDVTQRVAVSGSELRDVTFRLTRAPARRAATPPRPTAAPVAPPRGPSNSTFTGVLFVDSRPRGARVLLDGKVIGTTPLQVTDIPAGAHVVRMELANHRPWSASTRIVAGQTARVTGSLERQP